MTLSALSVSASALSLVYLVYPTELLTKSSFLSLFGPGPGCVRRTHRGRPWWRMLRVRGGSPLSGWMAELRALAFTTVILTTSSSIFTNSSTSIVQRARGQKMRRRSEGLPLFLALLVPWFSPWPKMWPHPNTPILYASCSALSENTCLDQSSCSNTGKVLVGLSLQAARIAVVFLILLGSSFWVFVFSLCFHLDRFVFLVPFIMTVIFCCFVTKEFPFWFSLLLLFILIFMSWHCWWPLKKSRRHFPKPPPQTDTKQYVFS